MREPSERPLFAETVQPVCAPTLLRDIKNPLKNPADQVNHRLLAVDVPGTHAPTTDWEPWHTVMGLPSLKTKNTLRFSHYADAVAATVAGQGVVIGCLPLVSA